MRRSPPRSLLPLVVAAAFGCAKPDDAGYRGGGAPVDSLSMSDQVAVYRAALGGSFPIDNPNLSIVVDPLFLPRAAGLQGGDSLPRPLITALRNARLVQGTCTVPVQDVRTPLICRAERDGYAVRLSEPYALGPDSVQVHIVVQQYVTPNGRPAEKLRFERAYHVVRRGTGWRAALEARLPKP